MYAMDSLRLEKGYRGWKGDLTHEYTPLMASLDRFVAFDKPDFIGKAALLKEREAGPKERLVSLVMDEAGEADAPYCSPVLSNGEIVGLTVSSGYGHAIQKAIALAYVRSDLAKPGTALEVEILGRRAGARVEAEPLYDPANAKAARLNRRRRRARVGGQAREGRVPIADGLVRMRVARLQQQILLVGREHVEPRSHPVGLGVFLRAKAGPGAIRTPRCARQGPIARRAARPPHRHKSGLAGASPLPDPS